MPESYKYMSADEIAAFLVDAHNNGQDMFDMEQSFNRGVLISGRNKFDKASLKDYVDSYFYRLGQDFYNSLNDNSPAATQFKEQVLLLSKFYSFDFYKRPSAMVELSVFLRRGINIISSVKMRLEFLRKMRGYATPRLQGEIARAAAENSFVQFMDIYILLHRYENYLAQDEIEHYLDVMERLAMAKITSELNKDVPDGNLVASTIQMVQDINQKMLKYCGPKFSNRYEEIKNKFTLDNIMNHQNAPQQNAPQKPAEPVQDPKDKEIARLNEIIDTLQKDLQTVRNQKEELEGLRARDAMAQKHLKQAAGKLKVGIGSRGVKNMKKIISALDTEIKNQR